MRWNFFPERFYLVSYDYTNPYDGFVFLQTQLWYVQKDSVEDEYKWEADIKNAFHTWNKWLMNEKREKVLKYYKNRYTDRSGEFSEIIKIMSRTEIAQNLPYFIK